MIDVASMNGGLSAGDFVHVRGRNWLVESGAIKGQRPGQDALPIVSLACVDDDAQGERMQVLWDAEIDPQVLPQDDWSSIGSDGEPRSGRALT